ncbi:hypothetical protein PQX77_000118 [Marasmius sp. AFHP31]|nr:hypothetical protein PQX77_000118 [Marasmius sp. AFHP31]
MSWKSEVEANDQPTVDRERECTESVAPPQREFSAITGSVHGKCFVECPTTLNGMWSMPPRTSHGPKSTKLLEPHVLSFQLQSTCRKGKFDAAISRLKTAPLDAQNVAVWNTLIWECMKGKKFEQAYQLYIDMKRRGFSPNIRTFGSMLKGYSTIDDWSRCRKQFQHATSVYTATCDYLRSVREHDPSSKSLNVSPIASYIRILGDNGRHQEIFDVFYAMDTTGPLAPDQYIFEAMFRGLRAALNTETSSQHAASAKLLWTTMLKQQSKTGFSIDSHLVCAAISVLARGRPTDQQLAFDIAREYLGLEAPGSPRAIAKIPLSPTALAVVLDMCSFTRRWDYLSHIFERVAKEQPEIIDKTHLESYILGHAAHGTPGRGARAYEALERFINRPGRSAIQPSRSTLQSVIRACDSPDDWRYVMKAFDLLTGYHSHDFMDGSISDRPRKPKGLLQPSAGVLNAMLNTALRNGNFAHVRQVLRLIHHIEVQNLVEREKGTVSNEVMSLAQAIIPSVEMLLEKNAVQESELKTFTEVKGSASYFLRFRETAQKSFKPKQYQSQKSPPRYRKSPESRPDA